MVQHEKYVALSNKYLQEGERLLGEEDYPQAAEKLWGATAESIKAIAALRGWRHSSHRDLLVAIGMLYRETGDDEIRQWFSSAQSLHANFYEDFAPPELVRPLAEDARRLMAKLQALAE